MRLHAQWICWLGQSRNYKKSNTPQRLVRPQDQSPLPQKFFCSKKWYLSELFRWYSWASWSNRRRCKCSYLTNLQNSNTRFLLLVQILQVSLSRLVDKSHEQWILHYWYERKIQFSVMQSYYSKVLKWLSVFKSFENMIGASSDVLHWSYIWTVNFVFLFGLAKAKADH